MIGGFSMYVLDGRDLEKVSRVLGGVREPRINVASEEFSDAVKAVGYIGECLDKRFYPWVFVRGIV